MTDDEILDAVYKAFLAHAEAKAGRGDYQDTYDAAAIAEAAMADRFGLAAGWKRYLERYPKPK